MFLSRFALVLTSLLPTSGAFAHEFWLDTPAYQVQPGAEMTTDIRNGQLFEGTRLAYFPNNTERFDITFDGATTAIEARMGDIPALKMAAPNMDGLAIIAHEAKATLLTYSDWQTFVGFTVHKDFMQAVADHRDNGYPQDKVRERYSRHSKALIAVGDGHGDDKALGLETELVALTNPYTLGADQQMEVALTYQQEPRRDVQVEVYERTASKDVTVTKYRTDDAGHVQFPVTAGMTYLVDAVVLRPAPDVETTPTSPHWESLWASLTFAVPE
ncbi:DUF4198 domain-containing protein [Sulfitobacter sp. M13]